MPDAHAQQTELIRDFLDVTKQDAHMGTKVDQVVAALEIRGGRAALHTFSRVQSHPKRRLLLEDLAQAIYRLVMCEWAKGKTVFLAHAIEPDYVRPVET